MPKLMRHLPVDARGYPIPWIIFRDASNQPYFAINDSRRVLIAKQHRLCSICGEALQTLPSDNSCWLIGGPLSALHENGSYNNPALHRLCGIYALKVCPYLALPSWSRNAKVGNKMAERIPADMLGPATMGFQDPTSHEPHLARKPSFFVFIKTHEYEINPKTTNIRPQKPYLGIEIWLDGNRITGRSGLDLLRQWYDELPVELRVGVQLPAVIG